jgi:D-alanine transaminase
VNIVYLNGEFLPLEEARIPVLDRGFIFGDGVYEIVPVYSGHPFRLTEHLKRLQHSLDGIRLSNPHTEAEWGDLIARLIEANEGEDQSIYLHITRGVAKRDHVFPKGVLPTVFVMSSPLAPPLAEWRENGVKAITATDDRWLHCDIKAISLLPNVLLRQLAVEAEALETILLREGFLTEGTASNIFVAREGTLFAPPKSNLMLELAEQQNIPCNVHEISEFELRSANEIWLTSSTREVLPVTGLDGNPVGDGRPGELYRRMNSAYQAYKATVMRGR